MSAGSQAPAAVREFKDWLQETLACITERPLSVSPGGYEASRPEARPHTVSFGAFPVSLAGPARIALSVDHHYRILRPTPHGRYRVQTVAYYYALDDADGREILAYHWHPGPGNVPYPHLHVGPGAVDVALLRAAQRSPQANALRPDLANAYLPTGRVALEDVVQPAIEQFAVPAKRKEWEATLQRSRAAFEAARSWHDRPPP